MFQSLREASHLSRHDLAEAIHVTPGYLLKAEQCVFPTPPAPLIEYWSKTQQLDRDFLKAAYYDNQRRKRHQWLVSWIPDKANIQLTALERAQPLSGLCSLWVNRFSSNYHPSQYAISAGLCVPPSAVYFAERHPDKPLAGSIMRALDDLIEYAESGAWHADDYYGDDTNEQIDGLRLMREVLNDRHSNTHTRLSA